MESGPESENAEVDRALLVGAVVGGYFIERQLAEGGMGTVYVGRHTVLARSAAIKVLHAELVGIDPAREGLLREARILEEMADPRVARIYDAGVLPDGRPWIAMELLAGECLADRLADQPQLGLAETAAIVGAIVDTLAAAHLAGVVHSDIKPENIMVSKGRAGVVAKLIDWGIATSLVNDARIPQMSAGTPHYMAPEQVLGERLDERADIYALGAMIYELLIGRPPFLGETAAEIAAHQVSTRPRPLREQRSDVPRAIDSLVLLMLSKAAADRPTLDTIRCCFALVEEPPDVGVTVDVREHVGARYVEPAVQSLATRETMRFRRSIA